MKEQTYYRRQHLVWTAGMEERSGLASQERKPADFAEYTLPEQHPLSSETAIVLHLQCGSVEIRQGADRGTIENTLTALQKLC